MATTWLMLLVGLLTTTDAVSQRLFKTLTARDGLTSSQINCIHKDERGFMWFGTPAGLYRYDGYQFKHFQSDSQDGSSLPDSYIETINEAIGGELWIKTSTAYCIYHPQSESFERNVNQVFTKLGIEHTPTIIFIDSKKNLWGFIPEEGIVCYNMQQQLVYKFAYDNTAFSIPQGNVCSIGECKDGAVVVYDDGRIVCCNAMRQQTVPWRNYEIAQRHLRKTPTLKVVADAMDNIWLYGQGTLFLYNKKSNIWNTTIGDSLGLTGTNVDNAVNSMACDYNGNIWLATARHGLVTVNMADHKTELVEMRTMRNTQRLLSTVAVQSVYVDDSDLLWVGTAKSGVAYLGNNIYKFTSEMIGDVTAMAQDSTGHIWFGTNDNGIEGYDGPLASLKVTCMAFMSDGSLWVGSRQNGLTRIKNGTARIYSTQSSGSTIINDHINDMCTDKTGNLWIATDGGIQMFNLRMEQFSKYTKDNSKLRTNIITSLHYASGNRMLIGTSEGLAILNVSNAQTSFYTGNSTNLQKFTNNYITQVFEDSRGLVWIGTREGINVFNIAEDNLDHLTEKQGLCNNNICAIAEDHNKNVWITTANGVCRVVVQRNHEGGNYDYGIYNYYSTDGLQSDEFNTGSILAKPDGDVLMGGLYGVSYLKARSADDNTSQPLIMFTQFFIGEEEVFTGMAYDGNVILHNALNETQSIDLQNDQNTFTIKFATGNYNQSERLQFMYHMEGLDNEWHNGDALKHGITFTDLPSGKYRLHVQTVSFDGSANNQERVLTIVIHKPWFMQWYMLVFYAVVILAFIYLWKKGIDQIRELWKRKNAVITQLMQQREDIKSASDELRQPMSRMTSIIMNLAEREGTMEEREQLNTLHAQMLQIITRVSDMQSALDHPEETAKKNVNRQYELNSKGEMELPNLINDELSSEIRPHGELPTSKFRVVFIDDNQDFLKFITTKLKYVYEFHAYDDITKAAHDIETSLPDLVICKHTMDGMTGSELCNNIKMHPKLSRIKFVLMTDSKLNPKEMAAQGITMAADDYLAKPFNVQEAAMRFNKLLGVGPIDFDSNLIEGAETRLLEGRNSSMTTATETMPQGTGTVVDKIVEDDEIKSLIVKSIRTSAEQDTAIVDDNNTTTPTDDGDTDLQHIAEHYSMSDAIDQQLIMSIEQYVQQNMSRGPINLEEMATAMGMSMKPFFQKVRDITGKTPPEVVRDLRLKHGCVLLQRTNVNMSELANNIGFATADHFINMFKERFGITPSEYRQRYRE